MSIQSKVLIEGEAQGEVLRFEAPISFWGGVDTVTSQVTLAEHPQKGLRIADKILVIPQLVGSSSSSAVLLELLYAGIAPRALILGNSDAILPIGVVVARQMGWPTIPVVVLPDASLHTGDSINLSRDGTVTMLTNPSQ